MRGRIASVGAATDRARRTAERGKVVRAAAAAAAVALVLALPTAASAATGSLTFEGCITSNSDVGGCTQVPGAAALGARTGLNGLRSVAVSADGKGVYTASGVGDAVARFDRDPASGALTFRDCITSDSEVAGCTEIPNAQPGGTNTGLDSLTSVAVSADGRSVYTGSNVTAAVARFDRDPGSGELIFQDCITSNSDVDGCTEIPDAEPGGTDSPLRALRAVAVSADGESVYTASFSSGAVAHFDRDPGSGALAYEGCISSNTNLDGVCTLIPGSMATGPRPLSGLRAVAVSADGESVYTSSSSGDAIARFDRDPASGALTYVGCITSNSDVQFDNCTQIPGAQPNGMNTGLNNLASVAVSADGTSVYTAASNADAIARFDRDPASGALTFQGCITSDSSVGGCAQIPGDTLAAPVSAAITADGESVYTTASLSDAIARFDRDPAGGALTFQGCITSNSNVTGCAQIPGSAASGTNTGLDTLQSVAITADDRSVYTASAGGDAVARFDRELSPSTPPAAGEPPSNQFSFGKVKKNKRKGIATLILEIPGPGELDLTRTKMVKQAAKQPGAGGKVKLKVKPRGKTKRKLSKRRLRRGGKPKLKAGVKAEVTYTPARGTPRTKQKKLKLVRKGKR